MNCKTGTLEHKIKNSLIRRSRFMDEENELDLDKLLADAIKYLIQGQELYEASILLLCTIRATIYEDDENGGGVRNLHIRIVTDNRTIYDLISKERGSEYSNIFSAFRA